MSTKSKVPARAATKSSTSKTPAARKRAGGSAGIEDVEVIRGGGLEVGRRAALSGSLVRDGAGKERVARHRLNLYQHFEFGQRGAERADHRSKLTVEYERACAHVAEE